MSSKKPEGCVQPAAGPVQSESTAKLRPDDAQSEKKGKNMPVMVGKPAPDFEAAAFHKTGFKNIKLSDFKGKWVFLCFYPGDFTFV
jgi:peroxiredoxin (alkyl hydroperoxide reductase subunit C)